MHFYIHAQINVIMISLINKDIMVLFFYIWKILLFKASFFLIHSCVSIYITISLNMKKKVLAFYQIFILHLKFRIQVMMLNYVRMSMMSLKNSF
jgi:hypothetical protein